MSRFADLTAIADQFRTDKGSIDGDRHLYTELYAACFESFRLQTFDLLEIGLLRARTLAEEIDPFNKTAERIPSVEMWLEFFPNAHVHGFDLADFSRFETSRFSFLRGDLSQDADIDRLARSVPSPRIIVDDASHVAFHQQRTFLKLFPILAPGGFYVIEDLHYAPPFEHAFPPCRRMAEVVQAFLDTGTLRLDFGAPEEAAAVAAQVAHTFMHCSARGRSGWGPKLVIFQKILGQKALGQGADKAAAVCTRQLDAGLTTDGPGSSRLTPGWLTSRAFRFHAEPSGWQIAPALRFERDGRITGYSHPNETAWRIEDGRLLVLRQDGTPSCIAAPTLNADGSVSLAGPFSPAPATIHHFDEVVTNPPRPEVHSFDLFDTLVARRCHDPIAIFHAVEARSGMRDFALVRQTLEAKLWHAGDYDFDDIYRTLGQATGWPAAVLDRLRMLELAEEWDNLFPIADMVSRVGSHDLIVSDMYLPFGFLRRLVDETCDLPGRPLVVSSHGKSRGAIWPRLLASHHIRRHHGDNLHSDVIGPRSVGIETEHVAVSGWSRGEQILRDAGLEDFARAIREARLTYHSSDPASMHCAVVQFELNLPLLILASLDVVRHAAADGIDTLLMCARDCNLWGPLMACLAPRTRVAPNVRYLISSRVLLVSGSPEYRTYFEQTAGLRSMMVDVAGTGRSLAHFIATSDNQHRTGCYLLAAGARAAPFMEDLAPARGDVTMRWLLRPDRHHLFLESLNMSLDGRAVRMDFDGRQFQPCFASNEFGPSARLLLSAMRDAFMHGMGGISRAIGQVPDDVPVETLRAAAAALLALAPDYEPLMIPILRDIDREEHTVAAMAIAERQRQAVVRAPTSERAASALESVN